MPSDRIKNLKKAFKSENRLATRVSLSWFIQHLNSFRREGQIDEVLKLMETIMKEKSKDRY
jgi:hypothetical protein